MTEIVDSLRGAIETCDRAMSGELLPHQVDAWDLWETLSSASDRLSDAEDYLLYASLMKKIVGVVRLQCRWLRYEADELYVDSDIAREKMKWLSTRRVNTIFLKSFHPIAEIEQMTAKALQMGADHWGDLPEGSPDEDLPPESFMTFGSSSIPGRMVLQERSFEDLLGELENELREEFAADGGEVSYLRFISEDGRATFPDMVTRSYLGSFLISRGRFALAANGGELKIVPGDEEQSGRTRSLAVVLRRFREGRG